LLIIFPWHRNHHIAGKNASSFFLELNHDRARPERELDVAVLPTGLSP
jgi:hypothetical protein